MPAGVNLAAAAAEVAVTCMGTVFTRVGRVGEAVVLMAPTTDGIDPEAVVLEETRRTFI